jgi:hypothetical protein
MGAPLGKRSDASAFELRRIKVKLQNGNVGVSMRAIDAGALGKQW